MAQPSGAMHPPGTVARRSGSGMHLAWVLAHWATARTRHGAPAHRDPMLCAAWYWPGRLQARTWHERRPQPNGQAMTTRRRGQALVGKRLPARRPEIVVPNFGV